MWMTGCCEDLRPAVEETLRVPCKVLPRPAGSGVRLPRRAAAVPLLGNPAAHAEFSYRGLLASAGRRRRGSLHPDSHVRFRRGADGWAPAPWCQPTGCVRSSTALPPDQELFRQRVIKEAVHELGHTLNLTHCDDYRCAMASSHAVEWIDLKESTLCAACRAAVTPMTQVQPSTRF